MRDRMSEHETVKVYVPLLDEGTPTLRGTQAVPLGDNLYRILATPDYDPEDETWEFLPGSVVRCDLITDTLYGASNKKILRAYEVRLPDGTFQLSEDLQKK